MLYKWRSSAPSFCMRLLPPPPIASCRTRAGEVFGAGLAIDRRQHPKRDRAVTGCDSRLLHQSPRGNASVLSPLPPRLCRVPAYGMKSRKGRPAEGAV